MPILQRDLIIRTIILSGVLLLILQSTQFSFKDPSRKAFACQCRYDPEAKPTDEALNESKAVFSGVVTDINAGGLGKIVQFDVDRAWKGISNKSVMATTGYVEASCGYSFEIGKEYLVYSYGGVYSPEVSLCSRTKPLSDAQEDLLVLGAGYVPTQDSGVKIAPQQDGTFFPFVAGAGGIIIAAGVIAYFALRARKRKAKRSSF